METKKKEDRKLLGSQIEDRILEYIEKKPLAVGDRLPNEFELAEMFEVGRSTIREAVKGLVTKGVLQVRRGAGTYVQSLTPVEDDPLGLTAKLHDKFKLALDLFDVRLILEPEIAAKAAVYATDEDIETLKRLCKETEETLSRGQGPYAEGHRVPHLDRPLQQKPGHGIPDPDHQFGDQYVREPDKTCAADGDDRDSPRDHGGDRFPRFHGGAMRDGDAPDV